MAEGCGLALVPTDEYAEYDSPSIDAEVFNEASAVENFFRGQALLVDKNGDEGVPHSLW